MKKYIILLLLIIALVLIGIFFYQSDKNIEENEEPEETDKYLDYETYSNIGWGFEIKHPSDWKQEISQDNPDQFSIGFISPSEDESDLIFENVIVSALGAEEIDFDEKMEDGIEAMSLAPNIDLRQNQKTTLSGYPAYVLEYSASDYSTDFKYLHYFINGGEEWYQILYTAEANTYDSYLETAERIINSIVIK